MWCVHQSVSYCYSESVSLIAMHSCVSNMIHAVCFPRFNPITGVTSLTKGPLTTSFRQLLEQESKRVFQLLLPSVVPVVSHSSSVVTVATEYDSITQSVTVTDVCGVTRLATGECVECCDFLILC